MGNRIDGDPAASNNLLCCLSKAVETGKGVLSSVKDPIAWVMISLVGTMDWMFAHLEDKYEMRAGRL